MGLAGMINSVVRSCDLDLWATRQVGAEQVLSGDRAAIARAITGAEQGRLPEEMLAVLRDAAARSVTPVLGITGTGGSGKSSLTDELVRRFRVDQQDKLRVAVIAVDPTRRKGGGALLGDRIRMNSLDGDRIFFRSLATRGAHELPAHLADVIDVVKAAGFDLVVVETPGIGQGDAAIVPFVDTSMYVMTPEFGAASQLEKIDMLDFADVVAINKFERRGAADALRDVGRQLVRNREAFGKQPADMPVYGTSAATFNDDGVTALYQHLRGLLAEHGLPFVEGTLPPVQVKQLLRHPTGRARRPGPLPRRDHRDRPRLPRAHRRAGRAGTARAAPRRRGGRAGEADAGGVPALLEQARKALRPRGRRPARGVALGRGVLLRRRAGRGRARPGDPHDADPRVAVGQPDPARLAADVRRPRRAGPLLAPREPARLLPLHRRGLPVQARRRGPRADVRRRGRPLPHQPPLQAPLRGRRGHPAVDRLRLGDALRPRPRRAPRHLRQGRHVRRLGRHARRHEGPLRRLRPGLAVHQRLDDDQRSGADGAGLLPQHRDRPAGREVPRARGARPRRRRARRPGGVRPGQRARHGAGRHPQGGPGPEHLPVLHGVLAADDGRHPGVVHPAEGAQLLLRVASPATTSPRPGRTPSASSRSRSPTASPTSRPTSRAAWTSTTSRPTCRSSSPTAWTPSTPSSAASPAASGRSR